MIETLEAIINTSPPSPVKVVYGRVIAIREPVIHVTLPFAPLGAMCEIFRPSNLRPIRALIVGFERDVATLAPFDSLEGIAPGSIVKIVSHTLSVKCGASLLGTMVDAFGAPLTPQKISPTTILPLNNNPPSPLEREPVTTQFHTGIRVIDTLFPIGFGQRVGIFAEPGAGKSTLLAMIAQQSAADVAVIALVGERGREVQEFVTESLGNSGRARSVVVACTSDEPPIRRAMAPFTATTIAEYFRAQGKNVLLLVDSLTRSARAIRDVGLAAGEMPIRQGYTPSVYTKLPALIERAGATKSGSITALYTVLTSGDTENDPLSEEVRSLLDGHIILSPEMIALGIRPAIDPTRSLSRLASKLIAASEQSKRNQLLYKITRWIRERDVIALGGTPDNELKAILAEAETLKRFLNQ